MKYTYEEYYKSHRPDGRMMSSQAAFMEILRRERPALTVPKDPTKEEFLAWQKAIRAKAVELLRMPAFGKQPDPVLLSTVQREGYRAEKWEFYPNDVAAVPVLMLVPDGASAENPVPAVFCFTGSNHNKEFIAGEPPIEGKAGHINRYPERNRMGQYYAQAGMIAVCFDHPGISETALDTDDVNYGWHSRDILNNLLLMAGYSYAGLSVQQALCFLDFVKTLPFVDVSRIATSGHSLGTEPAIYMAMASDDIAAVVFNDMCASHIDRALSVTEHETTDEPLHLGCGFHLVPGTARYYDLKDLCAALAPRPLTMNEGGPDCYLDAIRATYAVMGAEDKLSINHYPKYQDPATRRYHGEIPLYGLSIQSHFDWSYTDAPDHSFRKEPSVAFLTKHFFGEK